MKTSFKSKIAVVVLIAGLSFACKKNDTMPTESTTTYETDSVTTTIDSVDTQILPDTTIVDTTTAIKSTKTTTTTKTK